MLIHFRSVQQPTNIRHGVTRSHQFFSKLKCFPPFPEMDVRSSLSKLCRDQVAFSTALFEGIVESYCHVGVAEKWSLFYEDLNKIKKLIANQLTCKSSRVDLLAAHLTARDHSQPEIPPLSFSSYSYVVCLLKQELLANDSEKTSFQGEKC